MNSLFDTIFYVLVFASVYVQVFFFVTFLENRKKIAIRKGSTTLSNYPAVTIIVPCYNEERTIGKTIESLLGLSYPKEKLKIIVVDDGSTDGTWEAIKNFSGYSNIESFKKENGGKYSALNLGLEHTTTDFVGCLDADSVADKESLVRLMSYFEKDKSVMAVAPSIVVANPKNLIQYAQNAEYHMSVFIKKMLGILGAIHVTPGPLSIFRKKVFDDLGPYHHAHNTEDMEIAYRMQKNHYRIEHCHDAYVYTNTPSTVKKLFKQRLRWIYGFINNTIDYRDILFNRKYGDFSIFTVPAGIISIISVGYLFGRIMYNLGVFVYEKALEFKDIGVQSTVSLNRPDLFFIDTHSVFFVVLFIYFLVVLSILFGQKIISGKWKVSVDMIYYFFIFSIIGPFWLLKAMYNTLLSRMPAWR